MPSPSAKTSHFILLISFIFLIILFSQSCARTTAPTSTFIGATPQPTTQTIRLDINSAASEPIRPFWATTIGSCNALLWAEHTQDLQEHLTYIRNKFGTREIRFHNILSLIPKPVDKTYDFSAVDRVYDAILTAGVRPLVEVSFMPRWLGSGRKTVFKYKANVTPPKNLQSWNTLIEHFTRHLLEKYGAREVQQWRFEIWNEPDISDFWIGSLDDYLELYKHAAEAIKRADPLLKVGGPASANSTIGQQDVDLVEAFLFRSKTENFPVDFITWHIYGGSVVSRKRNKQRYMMRSNDELSRQMAKTFQICQAANLPLYITEWNSTPDPRDTIHDEALNAAYVLNMIRIARGQCNELGYWTFSDIFAEQGLPKKELSGGFGLLSLNGLEKPVFKAFEMLNMTNGGKWIYPQQGVNAPIMAAWKPDQNELVLVLWNWPDGGANSQARQRGFSSGKKPPDYQREWTLTQGSISFPSTTLSSEDKDASSITSPKTSALEISINNLPAGQWEQTSYRLTATQANLTTAWRKMGSPGKPSPEQIELLKNAARIIPDPAQSPILISEGASVRRDIQLEPGDCTAIILKRQTGS